MVLCSFLKNQILFAQYGWTALHHAAWRHFEKVVENLLEAGSDVNFQTKVLDFLFFHFICFLHFKICRCSYFVGY